MRDLLSVFTDGFGIQVAVIAGAVATADLLLYKFGKKLPAYFVNYLPLALAIIVAAIFGAAEKGEILTRSAISAGVISYSVGIALSVTVKKIFRGEKPDGALLFLINEMTAALCKDDVAAEIAAALLTGEVDNSQDDVSDKIAEVIAAHAKDGVTEKEIVAAVQLILLSTENFRKAK